MRFRSTRSSSRFFTFAESVEFGIAPDGGLFVPETLPVLSWKDFKADDFVSIAVEVLSAFVGDELSSEELKTLARKAFDFSIPLKPWDDSTWVLELFHGPTAAFKDIAARFIAQWMALKVHGKKTILVATSGDTGGAVAAAFDQHPQFRVVILFPEQGVSPLQRQQLTCWSENVLSVAVRGSFDDCQRMVKSVLADEKLQKALQLTTANSINIARLLPQVCYYAASSVWFAKKRGKPASFIVPAGNMGNSVAGFWAQAMGFPIASIHLATNANAVLPKFFRTGKFEPAPTLKTLANAMDVGNPSNFERFSALLSGYPKTQSIARATSVDDETIRETIRAVYERYHEAICPHTATAFAVHKRFPAESIIVATAHPGKFREIVEPIIQREVALPPALSAILERRSKSRIISANVNELVELIEK